MTLKLNGTNSVAAPAYAGDDADTGLQCGTNELKLVTGGTEAVTVDNSGRALIGTSTARSAGDVTAPLQVEGTGYQTSSLNLISNAGASAGNVAHISLAKSRGTSDGSNTAVANGDNLGIIQWCGADDTDLNSVAASIKAEVDAAPGGNDMPGRLVFSTTADTESSPTERLRITSDGTIRLASGCPGIDFSGIQTNASGMTSETLDSYEEGTWTPGWAASGTVATDVANGNYTKIGDLIFLSFVIGSTGTPTGTDVIGITGVPFAADNTTNITRYQGSFEAIHFTINSTSQYSLGFGSTTQLSIRKMTSTGGNTASTWSEVSSAGAFEIRATIVYKLG